MQGPVYGIVTDEMYVDGQLKEELMTCFYYDEVYGTVINRFITQAVIGHPLTVYGKGGQTRGFLNIKDTMQCVYLSATKPAKPGELRVMNQMTETFSVYELAVRVYEAAKILGFETCIEHWPNPRVEKEEPFYEVEYTKLLDLGLEPHCLDVATLKQMVEIVATFGHRIDSDAIYRGYKWQ
jgi:UDP-sulfoquinovose synthase